MRWADELTLIATMPPADPVNDNGFEIPPAETQRTVYANKKSVGRSEFYLAHQAGIQIKLVFDVRTEEYEDEPLVLYDGMRYQVLRTYVSKDGELTELTLSNLSKGGGSRG